MRIFLQKKEKKIITSTYLQHIQIIGLYFSNLTTHYRIAGLYHTRSRQKTTEAWVELWKLEKEEKEEGKSVTSQVKSCHKKHEAKSSHVGKWRPIFWGSFPELSKAHNTPLIFLCVSQYFLLPRFKFVTYSPVIIYKVLYCQFS